MSPFFKLLTLVLLWFAVSAAGGYITSLSVGSWYPELIKPPLNPPNWVFAPVWTSLYILLAIVGWRVWVNPELMASPLNKAWRSVYLLNAMLNVAWSASFFGFQSLWASVVVLLLLLDAAAILVWLQAKLSDKTGALLLLPYLLWLGYALYLNVGILMLNRG